MALIKITLIFLLPFLASCGFSFGDVYRIGDSITLKRPGHMYFLCGAPSHCQAGQKVDVKVTLPIPADSVQAQLLDPHHLLPLILK